MKKKILSIIAIISIASVQFLQASSLEKAKELMGHLEITKSIDASFEQIIGFSEQMIAAQNLPAEAAAKAKELSKVSMSSTFESMKVIDWEGMFAEIYSSVFEESEIQALIDFYKSPIGQKFLQKQPELMAVTMQKMQSEMMKIMPKIQTDVQNAITQSTQEITQQKTLD